MPVLRVGLIGCGRIASLFHLPILAGLADVELAALAEPDAGRRAAAGKVAARAAGFADYGEMLAQAELDAVVICSPPASHAQTALAALSAGKHVYVEKPLACSLAEAQPVIAAWRRAATIGMCGFNFRFHPGFVEARRLLQEGVIGEPIAAHSVFTASARSLPDWKRARASGGGALLDLASHQIDLARYLFNDEVAGVHAALRSDLGEGDSATLHLRMTSGLLIQILVSMGSVDDHRLEVHGRTGRLTLDRLRLPEPQILLAGAPYGRGERLRDAVRALEPRRLLAKRSEPSFAAALAAFVRAARSSQPATPDLLDGWRSLAVVEAAERAATSGSEAVPESPADHESAAFRPAAEHDPAAVRVGR